MLFTELESRCFLSKSINVITHKYYRGVIINLNLSDYKGNSFFKHQVPVLTIISQYMFVKNKMLI